MITDIDMGFQDVALMRMDEHGWAEVGVLLWCILVVGAIENWAVRDLNSHSVIWIITSKGQAPGASLSYSLVTP